MSGYQSMNTENQNTNQKYEEKKNEECLICLELLDGEISESSCGHIYHYRCIQEWIKKKGSHRCCCICEENTEIVNIINFNKSFDRFKDINQMRLKKTNCCAIL